MENLHVWLFLFAGGTIGLLATFLLASERELRNKQREFEGVRRNQTDKTIDRSAEAQHSETHSSADLLARNKELAEKISSLSSQLEESQRTIAELQTEQGRLVSQEAQLSESAGQNQEANDLNAKLHSQVGELKQQLEATHTTIDELQTGQRRLLDAQSENQKLHAENRHLQQQLENLQNQLQKSQALLATSASQQKEVADRHAQLKSDLAESTQQVNTVTIKNKELLEETASLSNKVAANHNTLGELQIIQRRLSDKESENQQLRAENQELQQEIANLRHELQWNGAKLSESTRQNQDAAERDSKLQTEVAQLKQELQASHETIEELHTELRRFENAQSENQQLQKEIASLRRQLHASEARLSESARQNQEAADRYARLQMEVTDLNRQLEASQPKVRELEAVQQQLANAESREMIFRDRQQKLEAQMVELQREHSAEKERVQELATTDKRLAETERVCQELREEKHQLEGEIARWQQRLADSEATQKHFSALLQQAHELPTTQPPPIDRNHQFQTETAAAGDLIDGSSPGTPNSDISHALQSPTNTAAEARPQSAESVIKHRVERIPFGIVPSEANFPGNGSGENTGNHTDLTSNNPVATAAATDQETKPAVTTSAKRRSRVAIIPAIIVLAIAGALAVGFLGKSADKMSGSKEPAVGSETDFGEPSTPMETAAKAPKEFSKQTAEAKLPPQRQGTFRITRPTQIYSSPSENSALIASVAPGMKINVVDSRGGWLEIRSKHGRPPGFVRQDAAVRIDQN